MSCTTVKCTAGARIINFVEHVGITEFPSHMSNKPMVPNPIYEGGSVAIYEEIGGAKYIQPTSEKEEAYVTISTPGDFPLLGKEVSNKSVSKTNIVCSLVSWTHS